VLIPTFGDQSFWGRRVFELGVGPRPIPRRRLSAERLAEALRVATTDAEMRERAAVLGERIRSEDGVTRFVEAFERHLVGRESLRV
jgi:UDP:flavonoid glycosyltransferase YjiC (YdhE family)